MTKAPEPRDAPGLTGGRAVSIPVAGLTVVLWLEVLLMAVVTVVIVVDLVVQRPTSYASAVAILVLALVAGVWLAFAAIAAPRRRSWVRAAAITWQILQGAAAAGAAGDSGHPVLSWLVLLLALAGLLCALTARGMRPAGT
ncbi:MAG TPA: hypothetical protein VFQ96_07065 [Microbacteriaceae bacterium]|nr:hypothetical protein [Microbacteriaceae bacterium]